jgi:hypothetical protein
MATVVLPIKAGWKTPIGTIQGGSEPYLTSWEQTDDHPLVLSVLASAIRPSGVLTQRYIQRVLGSATREE